MINELVKMLNSYIEICKMYRDKERQHMNKIELNILAREVAVSYIAVQEMINNAERIFKRNSNEYVFIDRIKHVFRQMEMEMLR